MSKQLNYYYKNKNKILSKMREEYYFRKSLTKEDKIILLQKKYNFNSFFD